MEARTAALKVRLAADYAQATRALAPPAASPQDRAAQEMAVVAEVACVLTVSERTAGALLSECPGPDDGAAADPGGAAGRDDLLAARPDHRRRNHQPGSGRGGRAGGALPGPRRAEPGPRLPGRGPRPVPVPRQGPHLARTPPPGQHRETPHQERRGPAGRVRPGPGRHGLALRLPSGRHRRRDLGPDHRRRPRPPGPGRGPDPHPAPRRHRRHLAPHQRHAGGGTDGGTADGGTAASDGGRGRVRGCAVPAGAGPGHRPGPVPAGRHRRTGHPGRVRADPAVHGPPPGRRRRRLLLPGPDRPPRRRPAGNRPDQLPPHEGPAPLAPAPRRQVPLPRLQQPLPGQRGRPPPGLGRRRHHRHLQPRPALPQTPPPQTRAPPGHPPEPAKTTRPAGPHRPDGTTPANTRTGNHPTGPRTGCPTSRPRTHARNPTPTRAPIKACPRDPDAGLPPDPFPDWPSRPESRPGARN